MSERSEHIHIRVTPDTKQVWEQAVEEGRWKNRTHLIEDAVDRLLENDTYPAQNAGKMSAEVDFDPLNERLDEVNDRLTSLEESVKRISANMSDDDEGVMDLASDILDILPRGNRKEIKQRSSPDGGPKKRASHTGAFHSLTDYYERHGYSESDVYAALERLVEDMGTVEIIAGVNTPDRYFVRE